MFCKGTYGMDQFGVNAEYHSHGPPLTPGTSMVPPTIIPLIAVSKLVCFIWSPFCALYVQRGRDTMEQDVRLGVLEKSRSLCINKRGCPFHGQ